MGLRIHKDHARFQDILHGRVRKHLKNFIQNGEFIAKDGQDSISVPVSHVDLPHFRFLDQSKGGIGQGEIDKSDKTKEDKQNSDANRAGDKSSDHAIELEIDIKDLAKILSEELGLPNIEKRGTDKLRQDSLRYSGIHTAGPNALRHFKRSFRNALKRQIAAGTYDYKNPCIIPIKEDLRYRSFKKINRPESNAVIIYMMDVSGSMGDEQKEIVRIESFWIDAWLKNNYDGLDCRYIIHDATAKEVDQKTFFSTKESGGTMISSAYRLCAEIIEKDYPYQDWNIYLFHFSDGDNWSVDDTRLCIGLLKKRILPFVNQFSYGQVESPYGSGQFIKDLQENLRNYERLVLSEIKDREAIYASIKDFLGKGK